MKTLPFFSGVRIFLLENILLQIVCHVRRNSNVNFVSTANTMSSDGEVLMQLVKV